MHCNTLKQDTDSTLRGDGGSRVGEVRAGTTSPMPEHKGFMLQYLSEIHPITPAVFLIFYFSDKGFPDFRNPGHIAALIVIIIAPIIACIILVIVCKKQLCRHVSKPELYEERPGKFQIAVEPPDVLGIVSDSVICILQKH